MSDPHQKFKSTIVFVFMVPDEIEGKKITIIQQFSSSLVSFHWYTEMKLLDQTRSNYLNWLQKLCDSSVNILNKYIGLPSHHEEKMK